MGKVGLLGAGRNPPPHTPPPPASEKNQWLVQPGGPLRGRVRVPGDKSISHRALLLGAIAEGDSRVDGFLPSADCRATLQAIRALGIDVEEPAPARLLIHGQGLYGLQKPADVLDCVRSGTSMRLLAGLLAGQPFTSVLSGDVQLRRRPMKRIVEPLRLMGATILGRQGGRLAPLTIKGSDLQGLDYEMPVASAQLKSCLLLAGLYAGGPTMLHEPGPARDHTERMLVAMGCDLESSNGDLCLRPGSALQPMDIDVPGDFSSAAFLVVAALLVPDSEIIIEGVGVNPTRTGLLDMLLDMGADLRIHNQRNAGGEPVADLEVHASNLQAIETGGAVIVRAIDELPVLAVAATQARGTTVLRDAAELRVKETDRIATTVQELLRLGADIEPRPDGFVVRGPTALRSPALVEGPGAAVSSHRDHRLAMALTVAGLIAEGETLLQDTDCVADSFPGFGETLGHLRAGIGLTDID